MPGLDTLKALTDRYADGADHAILNADFRTLAAAIRQVWENLFAPNLEWVDATRARVAANADSPARVIMCGFPNILNPGSFVTGGLADGYFRQNVADAVMDFDTAAQRWGTEKGNQWYLIYALAAAADTAFTLKAMPIMRVKSQATQTISLGTLKVPNTGLGYGFTTNELVNAKIYMLSGAAAGLLRTVSANNNDNSTGGTITYSGTALTLAQGDWFVVLPNTNFRFLGTVLNNTSSDIPQFSKAGSYVEWSAALIIDTAANAIVGYCPLSALLHCYINGTTSPTGDSYTYYRDKYVNFCGHTNSSGYAVGYHYPAGFGLG